MAKARSRTLLLLGLACLLLIACQTGGTPKQADGAPTKSASAAGPQATRAADSASPTRAAGKTADKKRAASAAKHKDLKAKSPRAIIGRPITALRAVLYATLGLILVVVLGAITAERIGRRRKLA